MAGHCRVIICNIQTFVAETIFACDSFHDLPLGRALLSEHDCKTAQICQICLMRQWVACGANMT